jgi:hypothetical protein
MASAQQKPKKEKGTRNSKRHNGRAFKNNDVIDRTVEVMSHTDKDGVTHTKEKVNLVRRGNRYGKDGNRLTGKGKPSGKSFLGISIKRLQAQADARTWPPGVDGLEAIKAELQAKRDHRNQTRRMFGKNERALMAERAKINAAAIVDARRRRDGMKADA